MARLFLALPLPPRLSKRLGEETDRLRLAGAPVSWVKPENQHLTVRFLGEVGADELLLLDPVCREAARRTPVLRLVAQGLGTFPPDRPPRVVWCGVVGETDEGTAALAALRGALEEGLQREGYRREKSPFRPHITLGRVRGPLNAVALQERLGPGARREFGHFVVEELVLYESRRGPRGQEYHTYQTFPLSGPAPRP